VVSGDHDWNGGRVFSKASVWGGMLMIIGTLTLSGAMISCHGGGGSSTLAGTPTGAFTLMVTATGNGSSIGKPLTLNVK
jgi:hypothetical protein